MNPNIYQRLKQIETENKIWLIYLIIIVLSFYSNVLEKDFFINQNQKSKELYRKINITIFLTLTIIYFYFEKESWTAIQKSKKGTKLKQYDTLTFIASTMILFSGIIFLYIAIDDKNIEEEIAFN